MNVYLTTDRVWEIGARTLLGTIDGTGSGMLGAGTAELAAELGAIDTLRAAAAGVPLGRVARVVLADDLQVVLLSVLAHHTPSTETTLRSALGLALKMARTPVACPLLTCGARFSPERALLNTVGQADYGPSGDLTISVRPRHWALVCGLGRSLGVEPR